MAHFTQHTSQIDKILVGIGQAASESKRLLRMVFAVLAEVEAIVIDAEKIDDAAILTTASSISGRVEEFRKLLGSTGDKLTAAYLAAIFMSWRMSASLMIRSKKSV